MKLQVNTSGAWKDVVTFDPVRKYAVEQAVRKLQAALGPDGAKWCFVDGQKRQWLDVPKLGEPA